jgi:hypothetical protein
MKKNKSTLFKAIVVSIAVFAIVMTITALKKPVTGERSGDGEMRIMSLAPMDNTLFDLK